VLSSSSAVVAARAQAPDSSARLPRAGKVTCCLQALDSTCGVCTVACWLWSAANAMLQMRAGDKGREDGGGSGLTGQEEEARCSVAGVSLESGPGPDDRQHQEQQQGGGEAAGVPQATGTESHCVHTVGCDLHSDHQAVSRMRSKCLQIASHATFKCMLSNRCVRAAAYCLSWVSQAHRRPWQRSHQTLLQSPPGGKCTSC
jgi:hypothetical protein